MKARALTLLAAAVLVFAAGASPVAESRGREENALRRGFSGLAPGQFVVHEQRVPVEVVLIGFERGRVDVGDLLATLPATYAPTVRYPQFYGLNGRHLGLEYRFTYSVARRTRQFDDRFFDALSRIGREGPATIYQQAYSAQARRVLDIAGPILYIDGPRVERWLQEHDRAAGAGYRVYFINWHGRRDFRFHVYTKTDDPDPDTKFNFGEEPETALNSWGGSESRAWFYDFSAGPEWNTANWVVDVEDLDGDGTAEYRMPPIWEYAAGGYRAPDRLGHDMGLLTRYVAINLLFTTSPLYDPLVTAPGPGGRKVVDMTMFEDDAATTGADFMDPAFAKRSWRRFEPYYRWSAPLRSVSPMDPGAKASLDTFVFNDVTPGCWESFGDPFAQLFCYFSEHLGFYVPEHREHDYVAPVFSFNTTQAGLGARLGLLGFADDNWVDGTQSFVFTFGAALYRAFGYGFTATAIHEVGHHVGLSHPHDGYDAETGVDYGAESEFFYAWSGDESATVMHYLGLTNEFGEHNKDNMYRWETAGYLNWSNALAEDILTSGDAGRARHALREADRLAARSLSSFRRWAYLDAVTDARDAYVTLVAAAEELGVSSARLSAARARLPEALIRRYVCRPRLLQERLVAAR